MHALTSLARPLARTPFSGLTVQRRWLAWPLPALLCWALGWTVFLSLRQGAWPAGAAWLCAASAAGLPALWQQRPWRRLMVAAGFPLSSLLAGSGGVASAWWLLPLVLLAWLYPTRTWRDAPWYPTSHKALNGLCDTLSLPLGAKVLDAGCGLGHGLRALRREYPGAQFHGTEWSAALAWLSRVLCPWATVRRGDMWAEDWRGFDVVYLFQRPESMPGAITKARTQMRPHSWLVSMAFEAPGWTPHAVLRSVAERPVFIYRIGAVGDAGAATPLKSPKIRADMQNIDSKRPRTVRPRRRG